MQPITTNADTLKTDYSAILRVLAAALDGGTLDPWEAREVTEWLTSPAVTRDEDGPAELIAVLEAADLARSFGY